MTLHHRSAAVRSAAVCAAAVCAAAVCAGAVCAGAVCAAAVHPALRPPDSPRSVAGRQREPSIPLSAPPSAAQRSPTACGWGLTKRRPLLSLPPWLNRVGVLRSDASSLCGPCGSRLVETQRFRRPPRPLLRSRTPFRRQSKNPSGGSIWQKASRLKHSIKRTVFAYQTPKKWRSRCGWSLCFGKASPRSVQGLVGDDLEAGSRGLSLRCDCD
jgi:hypothetical protein